MRRRSLLAFCLAAILDPSICLADDRPPNVVLIVADDLGWADLGCYGSKFHRTPRLDALAESGKRFTQAYAACPVCSPTRVALMTGKHPARLHLTDWLPGRADGPSQRLLRPAIAPGLPLEEITITERFHDAGFATGIIGKWHLGGEGFEPTRQGFDVNIAGDETGTPRSYVAPFARQGKIMPGLEDAPEGQYLTDRLGIEAEKFVEAHKDKPFFLYLPHYAVHIPMVAPADRVAGFPAWDGTPHGRQENPIYAAMLESLDMAVGRVLDALKRLDLTDRTIVVFTSDNGGLATREGPNTPPTVNAPLREGKGWLYEGGVRVPLIVAWPGKIAPGLDASPVWSADLVPTLLDLCGRDAPREIDGVSLADLLREGRELAPRALFWHYPHYSNQGGKPGGAIRAGDWKLIESYETGRRELYHLGRDPREVNDLAESEPARVEELFAQLAAWRKAVGAAMPTPNPSYVPNPQGTDGAITLPARTADVHGRVLRFEPLPHKDTLGFWTRPDEWASWEFVVRTTGTFKLHALVGCGNGSGGSRVEFRVAGQMLELTVPETGGFQQFRDQELGRITIDQAGRHTLEVRPRSKPGPAVMDLREVRLAPVRP
jgi:arylsulfatase A-like enzyme